MHCRPRKKIPRWWSTATLRQFHLKDEIVITNTFHFFQSCDKRKRRYSTSSLSKYWSMLYWFWVGVSYRSFANISYERDIEFPTHNEKWCKNDEKRFKLDVLTIPLKQIVSEDDVNNLIVPTHIDINRILKCAFEQEITAQQAQK